MIPGVETFHPRSEWEPNGVDSWYGDYLRRTYGDLRRDSAFHRTPSNLWLPGYTHLAIHYTSAINLPDGDPGEILNGIDGIRALLARSHFDYLTNRTGGNYRRLSDGKVFPGYPLGYSVAIDWLGGVWEINGFSYTPAATSGWNNRALAVLMLTDRADPGSALMWRSMRAVAREYVRRGARITPENVWGHGEFNARTGVGTPTGCPGNALPLQIKAGLGDWTRDDEGDDDMLWTTLPKPKRAYDTRPNAQHQVDPDLAARNAALPLTPFGAWETREIVVGMATEVYVVVTAIGGGADGYFSLNDPAGDTSIIGFSSADRVETNGAPALAVNGKVKLTCCVNPAHVAVDVYATKP